MKSIWTRAHGAHRIRATDHDGNTVIVDKANELQYEEQYDAAARALCDKLGWHGTLVKGYDVRAGVVVGRFYVWHDAFTTTLTIPKKADTR